MEIGTLLFFIWIALLVYVILKMVGMLSGGDDEDDAKFNSGEE